MPNVNYGGIGQGVGDIFSGFGDLDKAEGASMDAQADREGAVLAGENAQFTADSTSLKESQANRELFSAMGRTTAAITGSGFSSNSGSALDILRQSAQEGATTKAVLGYQGKITETSYLEQQDSYNLMASAADKTASADKFAAIGSFVAGGLNIAGGLFPTTPK